MNPNTVDPSKLFSVEGMVVLVTGGATGIGFMITKAFARNGAAKVYIVGRRKDKLEEAAQAAGINGNVVPVQGDVTSKDDLNRIADQVRNEVGFVNMLVCNSGVYGPTLPKTSEVPLKGFASKALETDPQSWNGYAFAVNTTAVSFTIFAFLELLDAGNKKANCAGRQSQVLVTSSIAGYLRNPNGFSVYPLTKAATTHLVKCLSGALVPYSIRVNALAPGLFPSDLADALITAAGKPQGDPSVQGAYDKSFIPAQRLGSTADMAGTVMYMASQAGAYLNGCIQLIDGGRVSQMPSTY